MTRRQVAGFSVAYIWRVTIAAVLGILALKWLTPKLPFPALARTVAAV